MKILDSYLIKDGRVVGREAHEHRFSLGAREAGLDQWDIEAFLLRVRDELPSDGTYFPKIEADARGALRWQLRHPPALRSTTELYIPAEQDQRVHPRVKGPDYDYLQQLRERARTVGADDAVLHRNGKVLEAANAAIMFFPGWNPELQPELNPQLQPELKEKTLDTAPDKIALLPPEQAQVLASVTAHSSISVLQEADWQVHRGVLSLAEALQTPAWVGSSLHGWTRVTAWRTDAGRRQAVAAPDPAPINQVLWERAR
ncbi:aminotransferase class IV [Corynebacterium propinquum]